MAYVRRKRVKGNDYYQLVRSRQVEGKTRQELLLHLGKNETVDAAEAVWSEELAALECDPAANGKKDRLASKLQRLRELRAAGLV